MKRDASDIVRVAFKGLDRVWIRRLNVVEAYNMAASRSEKLLVWSYAEAVDLRFGMLDSARANARKGFPESGETVNTAQASLAVSWSSTVLYGHIQLWD